MLLLAPLALAACAPADRGAPPPIPHPLRVMSINLCTDQLVLALLPPGRIASVTRLARDPSLSVMATAAQRVATNRGGAEDVLRQRPELVVADTFSTPATRTMLRRIGYPMVEVAGASDWAGIRRATRAVAAAVDERARGEALVAAMDGTLARLARAPVRPIRVAAWDGAGIGARPGSLLAGVLTAAGGVSVAGEPFVARTGVLDAETLLASRPAALLVPSRTRPGNAVREALVARRWRTRTAVLPVAAEGCGTPFAALAAVQVRRALTQVVP